VTVDLPVSGPAEPLQVVEEERVVRRSAVHEAVGDDGAGVADRHADGVLRLLQDQQVGLVVADQELEKKDFKFMHFIAVCKNEDS
jgi:hypothetical protein